MDTVFTFNLYAQIMYFFRLFMNVNSHYPWIRIFYDSVFNLYIPESSVAQTF